MVYGAGRYGYRDVGPRVKRYGHVEDPEDEQIDPMVLEAEREKAEQFRKAMDSAGAQSRMSRRWTPEGIVYETASSKTGEKPATLPDGGLDMSEDFPDPPPPPPPWNPATADLTGHWPAPSSAWPTDPNPRSVPSPHGPPPSFPGMPPPPPRGPFGGAR
ncbi:hypothetical protein [Segniliparus rugosus]|uniref:Uncharacterized protein n=1 Tax=Segniliparus rugosus (strain ATCC BAA-974 / DSM 45345 / CCUG 50838 / CIP 108380 / JCM 13579 / CDC 945) TaxID=679197 RepID=U1N548_SEGRC|nr:hypothetical protein [Segniliparus rugosus]ERG69294.1 hypothetical protein HMPREF9336_04185 [Segniliparus rugosus ATCC BAA-974]